MYSLIIQMALFSNDKIMSIIMLVAIILITLMLESYSSNVRLEAFEAQEKTIKAVAKMGLLNATH